MDYENYIELYEAVYFFKEFMAVNKNQNPWIITKEKGTDLKVSKAVYRAVLRILLVNKLIRYDGSTFSLDEGHKVKHRHILKNIIKDKQDYPEMYRKALIENYFFFDTISQAEYEIYSRVNFELTFRTGSQVAKYLDLKYKKVLEVGGNSGGFASALLRQHENCFYTLVDGPIPCKIGREFNYRNPHKINFIEGCAFDLKLKKEKYHCMIMMNFLHDFDDQTCLKILNNCLKYETEDTKVIIIEDILDSDFEPKEVVMHGLRLSVACRGGRQRTRQDLINMFSQVNYEFDHEVQVDKIHKMMVMRPSL
jgi:hypothetical protein